MNNNHRNNRNTAPRNNQETTKNSYNKINTERGDTLIYAMGGLGEVGKNMYCFEHENEMLIIDSGVRFPCLLYTSTCILCHIHLYGAKEQHIAGNIKTDNCLLYTSRCV